MMIRPFTRVLSAAFVVLALALLVASPVQAAPSKGSRLTAKLGSNFLDAALSWLNGFLMDEAPAAPQRAARTKGKLVIGGTGDDGPIMRPNTGACIDPLGNPCIYYPTP